MERVNNGCLKKKKEFSFVTRESSEKKIFFMKEIFPGCCLRNTIFVNSAFL